MADRVKFISDMGQIADMNQESFNQQFCVDLEYYLCDVFNSIDNADVKGFWCDGVLAPFVDNELSKKYVIDNKRIIARVFAGRDGQEEYILILNLGNYSLQKYASGNCLNDCLPDLNSKENFIIDTHQKTIVLYLK